MKDDDGPGWWDGSPPARPIPVEGGLVARSTRGGIGQQWWSRRFIAVMESMQLGGRLTRGRAYARKGQVVSLDVSAGEVTAVVQGSRVTPYRVRIGLPGFTGLVWAKAEVALAEQAIHSARLLAGDFPPELEAVFTGIGAPLFPVRAADLTMTCSCPDHVVPCKHLAAAFYLLAERFDDDPFLILLWRGRGRDALLDRLRELRSDQGHGTGPDAAARPGTAATRGAGALVAPVVGAGPVLAGGDPRPERDPADFWTAAELPPPPTHPELPSDLLLRQLPVPAGRLGGSRLIAHLGPVYEALPAAVADGPHPGRDAATRKPRKPPET